MNAGMWLWVWVPRFGLWKISRRQGLRLGGMMSRDEGWGWRVRAEEDGGGEEGG
jgi:hypothetical protein